jgi:hypothetical protein
VLPLSGQHTRTERDLRRIERVSRQYAEQHKKEIRVMEDGFVEHEAILDNMKAVREELGTLKDQIKHQVATDTMQFCIRIFVWKCLLTDA